MKAMEFFFKSVLLLGLIIITIQEVFNEGTDLNMFAPEEQHNGKSLRLKYNDIIGKKGCHCSICKGVDNKINPILGKKFGEEDNGKSSCNICEYKKRMLQEERERQEKLQKCPFEILGSSNIKGKTSSEVFDEFRELVIPSQNGFFDMMRGVVKTMHISSEQELKWAKEKEAKELAKRKEEERKQKESKPEQDELVGLESLVNPKVTVVLKQTPCGQIIPQVEQTNPALETLMKRLPKDASSEILMGREDENLQLIELMPEFSKAADNIEKDLSNVDLNENLLNSDLLQQLVGYDQLITEAPQEQTTEKETIPAELYEKEEENNIETATESPYVKFMTNEELKAQSKSLMSGTNNNNYGLLPTTYEVEENFMPSIEYTTDLIMQE